MPAAVRLCVGAGGRVRDRTPVGGSAVCVNIRILSRVTPAGRSLSHALQLRLPAHISVENNSPGWGSRARPRATTGALQLQLSSSNKTQERLTAPSAHDSAHPAGTLPRSTQPPRAAGRAAARLPHSWTQTRRASLAHSDGPPDEGGKGVIMGVTILSPSLAFRRNHVSLNSRWRTYPVRQTCTKEELVFSLRGGGAAGSPPALVAAARDGAAQIDAAAAHEVSSPPPSPSGPIRM